MKQIKLTIIWKCFHLTCKNLLGVIKNWGDISEMIRKQNQLFQVVVSVDTVREFIGNSSGIKHLWEVHRLSRNFASMLHFTVNFSKFFRESQTSKSKSMRQQEIRDYSLRVFPCALMNRLQRSKCRRSAIGKTELNANVFNLRLNVLHPIDSLENCDQIFYLLIMRQASRRSWIWS